MTCYGQQGFSYIELLIATAIMSVACVAMIQLQQYFFKEVQSMSWMMRASMQLNSRFEYALFEYNSSNQYRQDWQQQTQKILPQATINESDGMIILSWYDKNQVTRIKRMLMI